MTMPHRAAPYLQQLRTWRTWLLVVAGAAQGIQIVVLPMRALTTPTYSRIEIIGQNGWRAIGILLIVVALLLLLDGSPRWFGHALGAAVYLFLTFAALTAWYSPGLLILAAGLHSGEFWLWARLSRAGDGD